MGLEEPIPRDREGVEDEGLWEAGYTLAAEYWPGLSRARFYSFARDFSLAYAEWDHFVGQRVTKARVQRFYEEGYGLIFSMLRRLRPHDGYTKDILQPVQIVARAATTGSILDFGGGLGAMAMAWADKGFRVGYIDRGQTAAFGRWWMAQKGYGTSPQWTSQPARVACYDDLAEAFEHGPWGAIAALDVLEHTWEPLQLLRAFHAALPNRGLLFFTADRFGPHPTHLERNYWLKEEVPAILREIGFVPFRAGDPHFGIGVWRKP